MKFINGAYFTSVVFFLKKPTLLNENASIKKTGSKSLKNKLLKPTNRICQLEIFW